MKKILVLVIGLMLCGCSSSSNEVDIKQIMEENNYVIIDVRTKEEYEESHVSEAINIPHDQIDENIDVSKDEVIFVYCRSGARSEVAYNTLTDLGYTVYDLGAFDTIDLPKE